MYNPFAENIDGKENDLELIEAALGGSYEDMEKLILRHQAWIYNIALRIVMIPEDAEDVTQEILMKFLTRLSSYDPSKAAFRTWLYRIVVNHIMKLRRVRAEEHVFSLEDVYNSVEEIEDTGDYSRPERKVLMEEVKTDCMNGMLVCLSRKERLIFVLGTVFHVSDRIGSQIMDITRANFRKILSRTRQKVTGFMNNRCGLVNDKNPCRCSKMLNYMNDDREFRAHKKIRDRENSMPMSDIIPRDQAGEIGLEYDSIISHFQEQQFYNAPGDIDWLKNMLKSNQFQKMFRV